MGTSDSRKQFRFTGGQQAFSDKLGSVLETEDVSALELRLRDAFALAGAGQARREGRFHLTQS